MKKFLVASLLLGTTVVVYAKKKLTVSTSCGTTVTHIVGDNVSLSDIKTIAAADNILECGVRPDSYTLNGNPI